jgi:hypothetical protein
MDPKEFEIFIAIKINDLVGLVIERKSLEFEEALDYLYNSGLYTFLLDESSKLWHLSSEKLFAMLDDEKENKQLIFPDYV